MPSPEHVLVTGGAGFIGSHLTEELLRSGHQVRVVDNFSTGRRENLAFAGRNAEVVQGDLRDVDVCRRVVRGIDTVFHVAALPSVPRSMRDPVASHENNVTATVLLLEASRHHGVRRFVYSSSSSVYGDTPVLPKREDAEPLPRSPYASSKLSGEQYVLSFARAGLVEGVALRYFNVFGPRQDPNGPYAAVIPLILRAAASGAPMTVYGDGLQTRDFTYVENVVRANLLGASGPAERVSGWAVNVGAGTRTSLLDLVRLTEELTGQPITVDHKPPRPGDVRDSLAGLERAREVLGYEPIVSLRDGLSRTWEWTKASASAEVVSEAAG